MNFSEASVQSTFHLLLIFLKVVERRMTPLVCSEEWACAKRAHQCHYTTDQKQQKKLWGNLSKFIAQPNTVYTSTLTGTALP